MQKALPVSRHGPWGYLAAKQCDDFFRIGESLCSRRHGSVYKDSLFMIYYAYAHCPCMQIDAAVELMLFRGESHRVSSFGMESWLREFYPDEPWPARELNCYAA